MNLRYVIRDGERVLQQWIDLSYLDADCEEVSGYWQDVSCNDEANCQRQMTPEEMFGKLLSANTAEIKALRAQLAEAQRQLGAERQAADSLAAMVRQLCFYKNDIEGLKRKAIDLTCRLGRGGCFSRSEIDELEEMNKATRQPNKEGE